MTPEQFVGAVRTAVLDTAVQAEIANMASPPGQEPGPRLRRRSEWFAALEPADREMVAEVARSTAFHAVFGFLCVFDGIRAIEPKGPKGELVLTFRSPDGGEVRLNDPALLELSAELRGGGLEPN